MDKEKTLLVLAKVMEDEINDFLLRFENSSRKDEFTDNIGKLAALRWFNSRIFMTTLRMIGIGPEDVLATEMYLTNKHCLTEEHMLSYPRIRAMKLFVMQRLIDVTSIFISHLHQICTLQNSPYPLLNLYRILF